MSENDPSAAALVFPLGAIAGDVIGSVHEHAGTKTTDFPLFTPANRFTDDSVLTVAVFLARTGSSKDDIRSAIATRFGYDLSRLDDRIRAAMGEFAERFVG